MKDAKSCDVIDLHDIVDPGSIIVSINLTMMVFGIPIGIIGLGDLVQREEQSLWWMFLTFAGITATVLYLISHKGASYWLSWLVFSAVLLIGGLVKLVSLLLELSIIEFAFGVLLAILPFGYLFIVLCSCITILLQRVDYFQERLSTLIRKTDECFNYKIRGRPSVLTVAGRFFYIGGIVGAFGFPAALILDPIVEMGFFVWLEPLVTIGTLSMFALPLFGLSIIIGRRLMQPRASRRLRNASDALILLLRAFPDDAQEVTRKGDIQVILYFGYKEKIRLEEAIANELWKIAPFYAVGRPGEKLPRLGAAKAYFSDEEWQQAVLHWMEHAKLVILIAADTKWVAWELEQVIRQGAIGKLIILLPPDENDARRRRWQAVAEHFQRTPAYPSLCSLETDRLVGVFFRNDRNVVAFKGGVDQEYYEYAVRLGAYGILVSDAAGGLKPD